MRKPHIQSFIDGLGQRLWRAKSRPEAKTAYVSQSPSRALKMLNEHRKKPIR